MEYKILEYTLTDDGIRRGGSKVDIYDVIKDVKSRVQLVDVPDNAFKVYKNGMVVYQISCSGIHKAYTEDHDNYTSIFAICGNKAIIAVQEDNSTVWMTIAHHIE